MIEAFMFSQTAIRFLTASLSLASSVPLSQEHGPFPDLVSHQTAAKTRTTMDVQSRHIMWQLLPANGPPTVIKVFH